MLFLYYYCILIFNYFVSGTFRTRVLRFYPSPTTIRDLYLRARIGGTVSTGNIRYESSSSVTTGLLRRRCPFQTERTPYGSRLRFVIILCDSSAAASVVRWAGGRARYPPRRARCPWCPKMRPSRTKRVCASHGAAIVLDPRVKTASVVFSSKFRSGTNNIMKSFERNNNNSNRSARR